MPAGMPGIWIAMQCNGTPTGSVIVERGPGGNQQGARKCPPSSVRTVATGSRNTGAKRVTAGELIVRDAVTAAMNYERNIILQTKNARRPRRCV